MQSVFSRSRQLGKYMCLYTYIYIYVYMYTYVCVYACVRVYVFVGNILSKPELICLYTFKCFQLLRYTTNNSIYY